LGPPDKSSTFIAALERKEGGRKVLSSGGVLLPIRGDPTPSY